MTKRREPREIRAAFIVQVQFLLTSNEAYDKGFLVEALRIANSVSVLVYDAGKKYQSLLTLLGRKDGMQFLASGRKMEHRPGVHQSPPLVALHFRSDTGARWVPKYDPGDHRWISFDDWWDKDIIFLSNDGLHRLTRKKLVFALRNKEGGSHFDAELYDPAYIKMAYEGDWHAYFGDGTKEPMLDIELATMRQISWELLASFMRVGLNKIMIDDGSEEKKIG